MLSQTITVNAVEVNTEPEKIEETTSKEEKQVPLNTIVKKGVRQGLPMTLTPTRDLNVKVQVFLMKNNTKIQ